MLPERHWVCGKVTGEGARARFWWQRGLSAGKLSQNWERVPRRSSWLPLQDFQLRRQPSPVLFHPLPPTHTSQPRCTAPALPCSHVRLPAGALSGLRASNPFARPNVAGLPLQLQAHSSIRLVRPRASSLRAGNSPVPPRHSHLLQKPAPATSRSPA